MQRSTAWAIFVLFSGIYLLSLGAGFYTSDGDVMFLTTASLAERGSFALVPDPGLPQIVTGRDGLYFGKYQPGLPMLAVPLFFAGDWVAGVNSAHRYGVAALSVLWIPVLAAAGTVAGVYWLAARLVPTRAAWWKALLVAGAAGLATPLWVYARTLFAEAILALVLTWAVVVLLAGRGTGVTVRRVAGAGLLMGAGIAVRAAFAIYALPILALVAWSGSEQRDTLRLLVARWAAFGAGLLPGVGLVLWHNAHRFGDPLTFGYSGEGFTTPVWAGVAGLLISPGRGIFVFAPPLVLSALSWWRFRREWRRVADFLALAWSVVLLFYGTWWAWHGGWAWGPRFVVPLLPLSMLPLVMLPDTRGWRWWAIACLAAGVLVNGAGVLVDVTPHFAATLGAGDERYLASSFAPGESMAWYALRAVVRGETDPRALLHLGELGLPVTWQAGLPGLALLAALWAAWLATIARPRT